MTDEQQFVDIELIKDKHNLVLCFERKNKPLTSFPDELLSGVTVDDLACYQLITGQEFRIISTFSYIPPNESTATEYAISGVDTHPAIIEACKIIHAADVEIGMPLFKQVDLDDVVDDKPIPTDQASSYIYPHEIIQAPTISVIRNMMGPALRIAMCAGRRTTNIFDYIPKTTHATPKTNAAITTTTTTTTRKRKTTN